MNDTQSGNKSSQLYAEARQVLPGGISRNTIYRTPHPAYASFGRGCVVTDIDGVERIDFANNMASLIHGHAHPQIVAAVTEQLQRGTAFTLATEAELRLAQHLCQRIPAVEKIRFANSGTEAVMAAIKAARAFTGKPKIAKTEGAYHGTYDYAEVSQKSTPANWGSADHPASVPVAAGTPQDALNDVIVFPFNDVEQTLALLNEHADDLAAVILDPLPHRVGLIPASEEFVNAIRQWTRDHDTLFILDEVITFRMGYAGAGEWYDVRPDLVALGKIIGGGFPVGAFGGSDEVMAVLDPSRDELPFPHSGTFSANPISMTAGQVAMELFDRDAVSRLNELGELARQRITETIDAVGIPACVTGAGSMFRVHLRPEPPTNYRSTYQDQREVGLIRALCDYLHDNGFMMINTCSGALSTAMTEAEIDRLAETMQEAFRLIKDQLV